MSRTWVTRGFESFRRGTFGNAGHNLYVSRAGVLQRIHQYDLDADGYVDLVFSNSHDYLETAPAHHLRWTGSAFEKTDIPTGGARCAAVADLTGDGFADLVVGRLFDGVGRDVNAIVYFGSDRGWGEHAVQYLPAPGSVDVAVGDFDGDGRSDLAFLCAGHLRLFPQSDLGFEPGRYEDRPIVGDSAAAADLDGDGRDDLIVRSSDGAVRVYWGGPDGLSSDRWSPWADADPSRSTPASDERGAWIPAYEALMDVAGEARPRVGIVELGGRLHVAVPRSTAIELTPIADPRTLRQAGAPVPLACGRPFAVATGDVDGDGWPDLVVAARDRAEGESGAGRERSWVYWGGPAGWSAARRAGIASDRACDVAIGDLDGDGHLELAITRSHDDESFTVPADIVRFDGRTPRVWTRMSVDDARRVHTVRAPGSDRDDLLVVNRYGRSLVDRNEIDVYFGGPDGFSVDRHAAVPGWGSCVSLCADLDDDGRVDLVLAAAAEGSVREPGSYVYRNAGPGFQPERSAVLRTRQAHGVACADLDRDGYLDLLFAAMTRGELMLFRGGPAGFPTEPELIDLGLPGSPNLRFIQLADWNGDGWLDLFVPIIDADVSYLLWGGPDGFSMERSQPLSVRHPCSAHAADLDGDGRLELIVGGHSASSTGPHDSFAYIYWNGPGGLREDRRTLLPGEAINSISVADFNNDGRLDIFVGSYQDGRKRRDIDSYIYWNRGDRHFSASDFTRLFTHSASGDFAADFNEDGWVDLAVANHKWYGDHVCDSSVWWNGPNGFEEKRVTVLPTRGPHGMVTPGPGSILDRGPEEHYESEAFELPASASVTGISWQAELGPKTWVRAQLRAAPSPESLAEAPWAGPGGPGAWFENGADLTDASGLTGRWVQFRLALGATNSGSTPRVTEVRVAYDG